MTSPTPPTDLIDTDEARVILGGPDHPLDRDTLDEIVDAGHLIQYRLTPRVIRYSRAAVLAYLTGPAAAAGAEACRQKTSRRRGRGRGRTRKPKEQPPAVE